MAFPLGFPVLGAMVGAAWVLAEDGTDDAAKRGAAVGLLVGLGLGAIKATADTSSASTASTTTAVGYAGPARRRP